MTGATKTAMTKPAKLSNGVTVPGPSTFINEGDMLRVDPREGKYLERAVRGAREHNLRTST
jgi:elongation factor P